MKKVIILIFILLALSQLATAEEIKNIISVPIRLVNVTGAAHNSTQEINITLFHDFTGGSALQQDIFNISLFDYGVGVRYMAIDNVGILSQQLYAEQRVNGNLLSPRINVTPVLYSIFAKNASNATVAITISGSITEAQISDLQSYLLQNDLNPLTTNDSRHGPNITLFNTTLTDIQEIIEGLANETDTDTDDQQVFTTVGTDDGNVSANSNVSAINFTNNGDGTLSITGSGRNVVISFLSTITKSLTWTNVQNFNALVRFASNIQVEGTVFAEGINVNNASNMSGGFVNGTFFVGDGTHITDIDYKNLSNKPTIPTDDQLLFSEIGTDSGNVSANTNDTAVTIAGGTSLESSASGRTVTIDVTDNSIGNTQLEHDTGQALTPTSNPSFNNLTTTNQSVSNITVSYAIKLTNGSEFTLAYFNGSHGCLGSC